MFKGGDNQRVLQNMMLETLSGLIRMSLLGRPNFSIWNGIDKLNSLHLSVRGEYHLIESSVGEYYYQRFNPVFGGRGVFDGNTTRSPLHLLLNPTTLHGTVRIRDEVYPLRIYVRKSLDHSRSFPVPLVDAFRY